jgi:hypothetical protein
LSGMTACAERIASPAAILKPTSGPEAAPKPRINKEEARRQAKRIGEDARERSAIRSRQVSPIASFKPEQPPKPEAQPPQASQQPQEPPIGREPPVNAALPPPPEPAEPNFPISALMPPPPDPAEPTFLSVPPTVELPPPLEPAAPTQPEAPLEAAMPPPPEAAEPSFPVAALLPPPSEPAEPSLPSKGEVTAESPTLIPFPELSSPLSMRPRFDWVDTVGAIEVPRSPLSEALEASEERIPSLIRSPWPVSIDAN